LTAYYNEIDPFAAQWIRNLIDAGHIAPGYVDERSIEDVYPSDLRGFKQCHFFAGIGVWSYALRQAGWRDDRPVWTGSCPCQPFSAAGKGAGFDDERHLWPAFHHLIKECQPAIVLGEQVASKDSDPWIDLVHTDLEAMGYAFGAIPFPSTGIGAPHIRDRLYWVADANDARPQRRGRLEQFNDAQGRKDEARHSAESGIFVGMANAIDIGCKQGGLSEPTKECNGASRNGGDITQQPEAMPTSGHWRAADWLFCRDGKWRPVEPGTFPLAHGITQRVGRLRAYGNAINAKAAQTFIECLMEASNASH
jgi:DNA (cytosine-5)-methyltransferase 1